MVTAPPPLPVLLVFTTSAQAQRIEIDQLLDQVRPVLNPSIQVMRVNETSHPEVVRSFGVSSLPAFVLLRRGVELWRYTGPVDNPELVDLLGSQLTQTSLKTS